MVPASFQILSSPSSATVQPSMLHGVSVVEVHKLKEMINQLIWNKNFYINSCSVCDSYRVMEVAVIGVYTTLQRS